MAEDISLASPKEIKVARKVRLSDAVLEASAPLIDQDGNEVGHQSIYISLRDDHPQAVKNKIRQAIIDMAVYLGLIPPQT